MAKLSKGTKANHAGGAIQGSKRAKIEPHPRVIPVSVTFDSNRRVKRPATEKKYQQLLASAAKLMAENGYDDTSIRDVGRETGLSLAGMYFYFESKEDLLYQIQTATFSALLEQIKEACESSKQPEEQLGNIVRGYLDFYVRHTSELRLCTFQYESLQGELYKKVRAIRQSIYRTVADVVGAYLRVREKREESRTVRQHTLFIFGMLNWLFMWFDPKRDGAIEEIAEKMLQMIQSGLPRTTAGPHRSGPDRP